MKSIFNSRAGFILAVILLVLVTITASAAASDMITLSVTESRGRVGDSISVTITAENAAGTDGGQFVINYDSESLKPLAIGGGALITDASNNIDMANLEYAEDQMMFIWVTPGADTADSGVVCTITFELLKEGEVLIEIDEVVISPDEVDFTVEPGTVYIEGNGIGPGVDDQENDEIDPDQAAVDREDPGFNTVVTVLIIIAALAVVGFIVYRRFKKPGAKHLKRE